MNNEKRDHPERNEIEILDEIRKNSMQNLHMITKSVKQIYLISSVLSEKSKWDFTLLVDRSIQETLRLKQELLISKLALFSRNQIHERAEELRSEVMWCSVKSALLDVLPIFGISSVYQIYLIEQKTATYK